MDKKELLSGIVNGFVLLALMIIIGTVFFPGVNSPLLGLVIIPLIIFAAEFSILKFSKKPSGIVFYAVSYAAFLLFLVLAVLSSVRIL